MTCGNNPSLFCYLDIRLPGTFVSSSCDIKINVNIVKNCCRNLAVRGLSKTLPYKIN